MTPASRSAKAGCDRRATEARELRTTLLGVALFAGIVLVNAILAILFIALMQALGLWMAEAAETTFIPRDGAAELPTTLHSTHGSTGLGVVMNDQTVATDGLTKRESSNARDGRGNVRIAGGLTHQIEGGNPWRAPFTSRMHATSMSTSRSWAPDHPSSWLGGPQLGHQYMRPLDPLGEDYRLVYYDARGSGRTETGDPSQLSFAGAVEDLEALRQALELDRISLLGHSLGGHIAYLYASRYPERMESLILVDVGPPLDEEFGRRFWAAMESRRTARGRGGG